MMWDHEPKNEHGWKRQGNRFPLESPKKKKKIVALSTSSLWFSEDESGLLISSTASG